MKHTLTNKILDQALLYGPVLAIAAAILTLGPVFLSTSAFGELKVPPNSVSSASIVDGQVTTPDLANDAVTNPKIRDGQVSTDKLADSSVTSEKIRDGTIVKEDIKPGEIVVPTQSLKVVEVKSSTDIPAGTFNGLTTNCPSGMHATGGGYDMSSVVLKPPFPIVVTQGATTGNSGWRVEFANPNSDDVSVIVKAECASLIE